VFGKNSIVGQKYFDTAGDKLMVTSCFRTAQGEGPYAGMPALFVRLAKCQLNCFFCDTFFDDGDWMTIQELDEKIDQTITQSFSGNVPLWASKGSKSVSGSSKKRDMVLVLTGGEPMLQKNIVPFLEAMNQQFYKTQIESNGLIVQNIPADTTLVVSPKCSEKSGKPIKYLTPNQAMLERADCLKFVMSADKDTPYHEVPEWAHEWRDRTGKRVFVSPMNVYNREPQKSKIARAEKNQISLEERSTVDEKISFWEPGLLDLAANQANHEYVGEYALKHGFAINLQLHLYCSLA
jgi:organic radical activating enzyme